MLKKLVRALPDTMYHDLRRIRYRRQIRRGAFISTEAEFQVIDQYLTDTDWVVDVGANVGHYTRRFADIVTKGRVIAFEPHPQTFSMLAANVADLSNVTLFNAALSDRFSESRMSVPDGNYYQASITEDGPDRIATVSPEALAFPQRIAFIKLDAEGHEPTILSALDGLIERDRPILMVEHNTHYLRRWSERHRYRFNDLDGSHNHILEPA